MERVIDQEQLWKAYDRLPIGVFVLNRNYSIAYWNDYLFKWTGISGKDITGDNLFERFPHLDKPVFKNRLEDIFQGGSPTIFSPHLNSYIIPSKLYNGEYRIQLTTVIGITCAKTNKRYAIFSIQDVTDQTKRISEYRKVRDDLQKEVISRKEAEEKAMRAKEAAEEATLLKDKFVSLVAHDLRSPISTAIVTTSLILSKEGESLSPKTKHLIDLIDRQLQSGIRLIEKVLVISRMQSGQIKLEKNEVLVSDVLVGAMDLKNLAENKGVKLINKIPGKMKLFADPILMGQVIQNLVSNAIKFCSEGDKITLFVPDEEKATIAVKDTGPGINQSFLPDIFRLDIKTTEVGSIGESGTGLGLPLSYDIMQAHGGSLTVQTKVGEGTTFFIQFPSD